ncbi:TlpA family protein disulfide reductase [Haloarchaeobius sp. HRN-SO-5]|uniref:TlpA family protein disulfide reductase n=1 Tax=Haloarchaeobius sp. HRN-SO-5 TaxID=3446118 RepID=UPI003EBEB4F9
MDPISRRDALRLAGVGVTAGLAGCLDAFEGATGDDTSVGDDDGGDVDWRTATLTDVLTDEQFTIADFDRPVLVETFAIWCSNCKRQQDELKRFHDAVGEDVVSVALNTDPNEDAAAVREHARSHGYDWRYAVSPPAVTRSLVDEFGASMTSPPIVPMVLYCPDGMATRLQNGHKPTSYLRERTGEC